MKTGFARAFAGRFVGAEGSSNPPPPQKYSRGGHPASRSNLSRAGGNRWKGLRDMEAVVYGALLESLTEEEVRRFFWLMDGQEIKQKHRERMAHAKAPKVLRGILNAWGRGMDEPLAGVKSNMGDELTGVNIGGIIRLGQRPKQKLTVRACDVYGEPLSERGIEYYKVVVRSNGWYANAKGTGEGNGWKRVPGSAPFPWGGASYENPTGIGYDLYYGPLIYDPAWPYMNGGARMVNLPAPPGQTSTAWPAEYLDNGTVDPIDGKTRAWFYLEPLLNEERRVVWERIGQSLQGTRLKSNTPWQFWCELNGVIP